MFFQKYLKATWVKKVTSKAIPIIAFIVVGFLLLGLSFALFLSPPDYQQGEYVRIMYIHVPAAWASMGIYMFIAVSGLSFLVWRNPVSAMLMRAAIPVGAVYCLICLITGMLWGKPIWGAYWVWDARLTSMLILFFLFIGLQLLLNSFDNEERAYKATAVLAIVGLVNLPIIRFSVKWWNTLHQPASVMRVDTPAIQGEMLAALLAMFAFYISLFVFLVFLYVRKLMIDKKIRREQVNLSKQYL
jgi:heme exporter protein C